MGGWLKKVLGLNRGGGCTTVVVLHHPPPVVLFTGSEEDKLKGQVRKYSVPQKLLVPIHWF